MGHLQIPLLRHLQQDSLMNLISLELDKLPQQQISNSLGLSTDEKPDAAFAIAYSGDCIFLKYYVREASVQARYRNTHDPVYKDSCVEFFISFQGEREYYNLEFNCLGTCRAGFGPDRHNRKLLHPATVSKIRRFASLRAGNTTSPLKTWHLTLAIPASAFSEHSFTSLEKVQASGNFYKCGDELPVPHFLAWNQLQTPTPNFHLPEFFGSLQFLPTEYQMEENHTSLQFFKA